MMTLMQCVRKDCLEFLREKRNLMFAGTLTAIGLVVLLSTLVIPTLLDKTIKSASILSQSTTINEIISRFFPQDLRGSIGIFSADVGIFYSMMVIIVTCGLIPSELRDGKWIIPVSVGVKPSDMLLSKLLTYGMLSAIPTFAFYMLYYFISSYFLTANFALVSALLNAVTLAFCVFAIIAISIAVSVRCRNRVVLAMLSLFATVMVVPDLMTFFTFGRYLPTYLLTFTYTSGESVYQILIPFVLSILCLFVAVISAVRYVNRMEIC